MNPVERVLRRVDRAQQRHRATAFVVGVIKKYGDDNGGVLVANLAHSAFMSLFPLLLLLVTVLVIVASGDPALHNTLVSAATSQFPGQLGSALTHIHALKRSTVPGLVVGLLLLTWGATQLAQAGLFTMVQVWSLPGPARPGFVPRLGRAVLFLGVLAVELAVSTLLASLVTFGHRAPVFAALAQVAALVANSALYFAAFRVLTPKGVPSRSLVAGAVAGGAAWTLLQALGAYVVHHYLRSDSVYGIFATVLGLMAWIYIGVEVTVYAAEINVVLTRRLWPRSILQPPLTEADRASMALQALKNQRREEQQVEVTFSDRPPGAGAPPETPQHPEDVAPPADLRGPEHPGEAAQLARPLAPQRPDQAAPRAHQQGPERPGEATRPVQPPKQVTPPARPRAST